MNITVHLSPIDYNCHHIHFASEKKIVLDWRRKMHYYCYLKAFEAVELLKIRIFLKNIYAIRLIRRALDPFLHLYIKNDNTPKSSSKNRIESNIFP